MDQNTTFAYILKVKQGSKLILLFYHTSMVYKLHKLHVSICGFFSLVGRHIQLIESADFIEQTEPDIY